MKIAFDVMGSDDGYKPAIDAAIKFLETYNDVDIILVGQEEPINNYLVDVNNQSVLSRISIINADDVIQMNDSILETRRKTNNSMSKAIELVANKEADAVISAGATGPFIAANHFILKELEQVKRPAFMAIMPTRIKGKSVALLDAGANLENDSFDLEAFALMANVYIKNVFDISQPKIALLNIGTEDSKGKELHKETFTKLTNNHSLNFVGNIESSNFMNGDVDIVVTDGFIGNITLKAVEGMARNLLLILKQQLTKNIFRKFVSLLLKSSFKDVKNTFDYRNTGGAILLGVNGVVFKAHGNSDAIAFFSTLKLVRKALLNNVFSTLKNSLEQKE